MNSALLLKKLRKLIDRPIAIKTGALLLCLAVFISLAAFFRHPGGEAQPVTDRLIRLHVVANSDSDEDQGIKYRVRDAVLEYMNREIENSGDVKEAREAVKNNLRRIEEAARKAVLESGKDYPVKACFGTYLFPPKTYGELALPAGYYQALKIEVGKAKGSNWWCVLFPPLCFVDATRGAIPDSVKENLEMALDEEEYKVVASAGKGENIPVKVKFKILEIFKDSRTKMADLINRLINP